MQAGRRFIQPSCRTRAVPSEQAQELLIEIDQAGTTKRYLTLPSGIQLYSELSADESRFPGGMNPFAFLDLAFGVPVTALRTAFPLGPSSVGDGESKKDIVMEGKPISITAIRRGQQIIYRLESVSIHATGTWERMAQNPLPGSYLLVGWISSTKAQFANLEQARSAQTSSVDRRNTCVPFGCWSLKAQGLSGSLIQA
jgi:hypothetical protein